MTDRPGQRAGASRKTKVAVLGGGAGGISAAFELTATPELRDRFEVTVHQAGWRLGGKGASGRDLRRYGRVEEHGLHVWFGFYANALDLVRRCYEELEEAAPFRPWSDAFTPLDTLVLFDRDGDGWTPYGFPLPASTLEPSPPSLGSLEDFGIEIVRWLAAQGRDLAPLEDEPPSLAVAEARAQAGLSSADDHGEVADLLGDAASEVALSEARIAPSGRGGLSLLRRALDFWSSLIRGLVECRVMRFPPEFDPAGIERLNRLELRQWLARRVRFADTLDAPFVRVLYDLAFAYREGDAARPDVAAGMAVRNLFRILFQHRGSLMLRMRGGMGDVMFAPLYEALRRRGVRFEFFSWITCLSVSDDGHSIEAIEVIPQVELAGDAYEPLVGVRGHAVWPSEPRWEQLKSGDALRPRGIDFERQANPLESEPRRLVRGRDFDELVLAIPVGGQPPVCAELVARSPPWRRMLEEVPTVATRALQIWRTAPPPDPGAWGQSAVAGAYAKPFDTYCDMTHLLAEEGWPAGHAVKHVAYFVGVLADADIPGGQPTGRGGERCPGADHPAHGLRPSDLAAASARVRESSRRFLAASKPDLLATDELADAEGRAGGGLDDQFWRANVGPSERYVLSPAGSVVHRLAPGGSGFANLVLAGDWTRTTIDAGSVEAAVISGRGAAAALTGEPSPTIADPRREEVGR